MAEAFVVRGARVIDGSGAEAVVRDVAVAGGRIVDAAPEDAAVVDGAGKTLMPGLIDAHCHITFDEPASNDELFFHRRAGLAALIAGRNARKLLRAGVTSFLDADCIFDIGVDVRDALETGVIEGPRMATGGNALVTSVGGTAGALIPDEGLRGYARVVRSPDEIRAEVRRQIKLGVDWIKVHVTGLVPRQRAAGEVQAFSFDELRLICDVAHELGVPVTGHCRGAPAIRDAVRAGFDMILHATFMDEAALELVIERRVPLVPTFTFQANLAAWGDRVGADPRLMDVFRREIADSAATLRRAYDAGVPLLAGTESGFSLTPYGEWHYREMEVFVQEMGLSPLQAIRCATREGGHAMRCFGEVGIIEPGALADLLLVDGRPDEDVTVLGREGAIERLWLGGRELDLSVREPERQPIPGWRVSPYSRQILDRRLAGAP